MAWADKIALKLRLQTGQLHLVSDRTGLLTTPYFLDWLGTKGFAPKVLHTQWDLLKYGRDTSIDLILNTQEQPPSYLCNLRQCQTFDFQDIPYAIEQSIARSMSLSYLESMLHYLDSNPSLTVRESNQTEHIEKAQHFQVNHQILQQEKEIQQRLEKELQYTDLLQIGRLWGELLYQYYQTEQAPNTDLQKAIDAKTISFILKGGLKNAFYEAAKQLRLVHKIPHYLKELKSEKIALICMDCMGVAEWQLLKAHLQKAKFGIGERFSFALIPSFTSISRTALYYGEYEKVFELKSINEAKYFGQHFPDKYHRHFKNSEQIKRDVLLGIDLVSKTFNFFDELCHSAVFPAEIAHKQPYFLALENHIHHSTVIQEIQTLKEEGFKIFLCSDHGSVVAKGNGKKFEKWLQEKYAKRAVVVSNTKLLEEKEFEAYEKYAIPFVKDKLVLLPSHRTMFDHKNKVGINHGGITLEEIVVPFIELI